MSTHPEKAFILAAGLGTRLRPYTDTLPKPMVSICGKPMIDHIIDKLVDSGIQEIVVNLHHKGDILRRHLTKRKDLKILFSEEEELLDTGGGVKKVLPLMGDKPFFVINGDAFWIDSADYNVFKSLSAMWDDTNHDMILLLEPVRNMILTKGVGDYDLLNEGRARRSADQSGEYMFAGVRLCHPRIFESETETKFSFLKLMDKADREGRLYGFEHQGGWHHISSPEELHAVEEAIILSAR